MKHSFIGFDKKKYKSVKYDHSKDTLSVNDFVKFMYGANLDQPMVGKVDQIFDKGVSLYTDYGTYHSLWEGITRVFHLKTPKSIKETKVKAADSFSAVPILDATLNKLVIKTKNKFGDKIKIKDNRVDLVTRYARTVIFSNKRAKVTFEIEDKDSKRITVTGSNIKKAYITPKNNKVAPFQLSNNFKKIKNIL